MSLRIAFFGSDAFSVQSLAKLVRAREAHPGLISSIDVVTRSIKPQGRKRKLVDVPIGSFVTSKAPSLGIPIHRADTRREILDVAGHINANLAVAVSYGKLIPSDFLTSLKHGGINVHPSMLPKYSGSSPIQYALMNDDASTGVTVQTLHPTKFDRGDILAQSELVPIAETDNYDTLSHKLGDIGSDLLVKVLLDRLYESPIRALTGTEPFSLAPKISPSASQILWQQQTPRQLKRLYDALGPLHSYVVVEGANQSEEHHKVILDDIQPSDIELSGVAGTFSFDPKTKRLIIKTYNGTVSAGQVKMQYHNYESPKKFVNQVGRRCGREDVKFVEYTPPTATK